MSSNGLRRSGLERGLAGQHVIEDGARLYVFEQLISRLALSLFGPKRRPGIAGHACQ